MHSARCEDLSILRATLTAVWSQAGVDPLLTISDYEAAVPDRSFLTGDKFLKYRRYKEWSTDDHLPMQIIAGTCTCS